MFRVSQGSFEQKLILSSLLPFYAVATLPEQPEPEASSRGDNPLEGTGGYVGR